MPSAPKFMIGVGGVNGEDSKELSTMQSINGGGSTSRIGGSNSQVVYNPGGAAVLKPFDSTSPRFNYSKADQA